MLKVIGCSVILLICSFAWAGVDQLPKEAQPIVVQIEPPVGYSPKSDVATWAKYTGAIVALFTFLVGQVVIPWLRDWREQKKSKDLLMIILQVISNKSLEFFGEQDNPPEGHITVLANIAQEIEKASGSNDYLAHISVTHDNSLVQSVLNERYFWLIDEKIVRSFIRFDECATRTQATCDTVNSEEYKKLVEHDRPRYVNALKTIEEELRIWLASAKELNALLKDT